MDNQAVNVLENRRFPRVKVNIPVQYKNLKKSQEAPTGTVARNLSEGGVCFKTNQFISLACRLVVEISVPNSARPIKAISKIAWIKKMPVGDQYELGNQFLEMAKEDRTLITNFITNAVNSSL